MIDVVNLSGDSNFPLRNATWSIVNISNPTPTTVLSGPYLTAVQPVSDDEYHWELLVQVPGLECTCYVEISILEGEGQGQHWRLLVFIGEANHRPVFANERALSGSGAEEQSNSGETELLLLDSSLVLSYDVVLPPSSTSITQVFAEVCEAPNGVCREAARTVALPFSQNGTQISVSLDAANLSMSQGVWLIEFTATDDLLRDTGIICSTLLYDHQPPMVELVLDSTVLEREHINIYASVEDGYLGASTSFTWTIIDENGLRRAPLDTEQIAMDQLTLNISEQGAYSVEVSVRDRAGFMTQEVSAFTVMNQRPTAFISVDGLVVVDDVRLELMDGEDWVINGNKSVDNEPVDYLWVINDDRSLRGVSTLSSDQFEQTGLHKIELIVFDDDGATHSTVIEIDILISNSEENASILAWFFPGLLMLSLLIFVGLRSKTSSNQELPKWEKLDRSDDGMESIEYINADATIEEDEARG